MALSCPRCARPIADPAGPDGPPLFCMYCGQKLRAADDTLTHVAQPSPLNALLSFDPDPPPDDGGNGPPDYAVTRSISNDPSEPDPAANRDAAPSSVGGFRLIRFIGSGGMGNVYEAEAPETGERVAVVRTPEGAAHLSSTNRYVAPELRDGEVTTSTAFAVDSDSRYAELEAFVAKQAGGIDADSLEELLGDHGAPGLVDRRDDVVRLSGPSVVSSVTVASIVAEPESRTMRMSIGRAPAGYGPYLRVPWSWDGPVGVVDDEMEVGPTRGRSHRGTPLTDDERRTAHLTSATIQGALDRQPPHVVRAGFEELCHRQPAEPGLHTMAAILAVLDDEMDVALDHLDAALELEATPVLRARVLLLRSRVRSVIGRMVDADADRAELAAITDPSAADARAAAAEEARRPLSRRRLRLMSPDVMLFDLHA